MAYQNHNKFGHVCYDCKRLQYVSRRELSLAARVRCKWCGGTLHESAQSVKKIADVATAKRERKTKVE